MTTMIRVFPRRTSHTPTDDLAFVGDPPLWRPEADEVQVSVTFSWDVGEAERLQRAWRQYYPVVRVGGPAFMPMATCDGAFHPGRYVKPGVVFTSRGCNNDCPWCLVPLREGRLRLVTAISDGHIINDNSFLQCPGWHRRLVFGMLRAQKRAALFSGGLQASLVTDEIADEFRGLRIDQVFLAADTDAALRPLERALKRLAFLGREKLRCYVLVGWNGETIQQAEARLETVWELGAMPHAQLFRPATEKKLAYSAEWRKLVRKWEPTSRDESRTQEVAMAKLAPIKDIQDELRDVQQAEALGMQVTGWARSSIVGIVPAQRASMCWPSRSRERYRFVTTEGRLIRRIEFLKGELAKLGAEGALRWVNYGHPSALAVLAR